MRIKIGIAVMIGIMLALAACSKTSQGTQTSEPIITLSPSETQTPTSEPSSEAVVEVNDPIVITQEMTAESTEENVEISHQLVPGEPAYAKDQKINDCSTGERIALGATTLIGSGCDNWNKGKFERPANAADGNYIPAADIVRASMGSNQDWLFMKIELFQTASGNIPEELTAGFELDTDLDSRGEYFIFANGITSNEWTTNGVQVWYDANGDVGGTKPHSPDGTAGDGFETQLFASGVGDDADLAWVRIDQFNRSSIEFAFKPSLVPENRLFAWWAWSALGNIDPQKMEMVDSQSDSNIWEIDNTCSWIFNGKPTNLLVNICDFVVPTPIPSRTPTRSPQDTTSGGGSSEPGCPSGYVWSSKYNQCVVESPT